MKSISASVSNEIDDFSKVTPIVGIIGATGCRQALEMLFRNLPTDSGLAFVVVANIGKRKAKALPALLQQRTDMAVDMATDGTTIAPDHVYVAPLGQYITIKEGKLSVQSPDSATDTQGSTGLLDRFLNSLAEAQNAEATAVLLSGTGTDGIAGLKAIHKANGLIFVQDPEEAAHGALPRRAMAANPNAIVASVGQLARRLVQNKGDLADEANTVSSTVTEDFEELYQPILSHIINHTGHDLSHYKVATLRRRIARRMALSGVPSLAQYVALLEQNKTEAQALFQDSLVSVTSFFRDPDAYEMLERDCIPQLFAEKEGVDHVRVWVVGCATGQEAYSIAMQLVEYAAELGKPPRLQVFATDLDENAIAIARRGIYPKAIAEEMTESRLGRFFSLTENGYQVKPEIREHVLFAVHNILKDPPFSNLDLITCRNVLIYFNREAQTKVFELFHYALNRLRPGREYLFLGTSESIDAAPELFTVLDKYCHLYQRCDVVSMPRQRPLPSPVTLLYERQQGQLPTNMSKPTRTIEELYAKWTLRVHAPPRLLVNSNYEITHIFGEVTRYLQEPEGAVTQNILQRILPVLRLDLRTALYQAFQQQERSISRALSVEQSGSTHLLQLHVGPITDADFPKGFVEVVFVAEERPQLGQLMDMEELFETDLALVMQMEEELIRTRGRLQTIIEEYENSSQELKTSNEELQSINEELKSTTEELETSKEELQSMNEELVTVNGELTNKVEALNQANSDLLNFIASSDVGTIFLTVELRISRFTPRALDLFNLIEGDIGRPFAHVTHHIRHSDIVGLADTVQKNGVRIEETIQDEHGDWYLLRLFPYRTVTGTQNGVVISFVDINDLKRAESEERQRIQQQMLAGLGRHALANQNLDELFQTTAQQVASILEMEFCKILEVLPGGENFRLRAGVGWQEGIVGHALVPTDISSQAGYTLQVMEPVVVRDIRTETRFHSPKLLLDHNVRSGMTVTIYGPDGPFGALGVHSASERAFSTYDIDYLQAVANTLGAAIARHRTATQLRNSEAVARRYVDMIQSAYDAIIVWHVDQGIEFWNRGAEELYGYSAAETIGQRSHELFQTKHPEPLSTIMAILTAKGEWEGELSQQTKDGRTIYVSTRHQLITGTHGETVILEINRDITAAKAAEIALRQSEETTRRHLDELEAIYNTAPVGLCVLDRELRWVRINEHLAEINGFSVAEHLGRTVRELLPHIADEVEALLTSILETGEPILNMELTSETPAQPGVQRTWVENWFPMRDQTGDVIGINIVAEEITERKATAAALEQSEARLRLGMMVAGLAVATVDYDTDTIHLSSEATTLLGLGPESLAVKRSFLAELPHPNDRAETRDLFAAAIDPKGSGEFTQELRIVRPDGTLRWLHISNKTFFSYPVDAPAHPVHGILVLNDTTAQKTREQYLSFLAALSEAIATATTPEELLGNGTRTVSEQFDGIRCRLIDLDRRRGHMTVLPGHRVAPQIYPGTLPSTLPTDFTEGYWPQLSAGETVVLNDIDQISEHFENPHSRMKEHNLKSLMIVPILQEQRVVALLTLFAYTPYYWAEDEVELMETVAERLWLGIERLRLIEELRLSETQSRRHLNELEAIYNTAPIGLCVMDRELRYLRINERLAAMNGRPAAEHIGRTGREVLPILAEKTDIQLQQVIATGEPVIGIELTGEIPSQPGVEHTWIESWLPLFDEEGQVSAINIVIQEITERKKTEEALARSEERYRFLFENIDDGFCIVEIMLDEAREPEDYLFLEANPSFERHTGLVNAIGKSARELIPNLEEHWIQIYGTIGLTGIPKRFEQGSEALGRWYDVYAFRVGEAASPRVAIFFKDITDRRTAELQLRQSENHLRDVLNNLASFVGVMTPDGVLTEVNRTALNAANLSATDVLGRHFAETYWWSYTPLVQAQLRTAIDQAARGEIVRYDVRVRIKEEQFIIIDFMVAPIFDEEGQVQYLIPSGMDVTERRLVENALRQSEEQFRAVQQATPDGFMIFESVRNTNDEIIDFRWLYVNPAAELITGRSHDELIGKHLLQEMPGNREEGIFAAYVQVVESGEVWQHEFAYYHDGLQHWLRTTAAKTRDGLAVAFTDITPSKISEEALRQSEMRFRSAFEQAAVGMAHLDTQGYYLRVNDRLCEILGYERDELVGKHFSAITHPDDIETDLAHMQQQMQGDLPHHVMEKRYLRKDGSYLWANMTASLVFNESDEPQYGIVVVEDISSRKAAEQALHELTTTLEDRVKRRTAELERSNRELDQFAYIASHDLRAPLRGINHLVDWITEDTGEILPPTSQKHLQTLRGRVRRMEQLLEDLLIYSRVGRHPTQVEWVNSVHLIEQLVELLQPEVPFEITVVDALPSFYTQRVPLELVLRNLINNAIKHHHRPDGQIQISAREQPHWVEFRVQDNGPGIAAEFHERIFQIFQTLRPRDEVEGSGMGLAVVKKTIESLGGEIGLESAEGEGSTFFFTWPKYPAP